MREMVELSNGNPIMEVSYSGATFVENAEASCNTFAANRSEKPLGAADVRSSKLQQAASRAVFIRETRSRCALRRAGVSSSDSQADHPSNRTQDSNTENSEAIQAQQIQIHTTQKSYLRTNSGSLGKDLTEHDSDSRGDLPEDKDVPAQSVYPYQSKSLSLLAGSIIKPKETFATSRQNLDDAVREHSASPLPGYRVVPSSPPTTKPLLNLAWQSMGNGFSRAFPRHALPPLLSSDLSITPEGGPGPQEGFDYFVDSDSEASEDNLPCAEVLAYRPSTPKAVGRNFKPSLNTSEASDQSILLNRGLGSNPDSTLRAKHSRTSERLVSSYSSIRSPQSPDSEHRNRESDGDLEEHFEVPTSNVQPAYLDPSLASLVSTSDTVIIENHNASTSNGFESDEDILPTEKDIVISEDSCTPTFARVAVLQAAERLAKCCNVRRRIPV